MDLGNYFLSNFTQIPIIFLFIFQRIGIWTNPTNIFFSRQDSGPALQFAYYASLFSF